MSTFKIQTKGGTEIEIESGTEIEIEIDGVIYIISVKEK